MGTKRFRTAATDQIKRLRTRALLMDVAIAEFARRGIGATAVDDIVTAADVSHGTFYYHFANKAALLEAVGRAVAASLVDQVDRAIIAVGNGRDRVAMATQSFIAAAAAEPDWGWLVVHALSDMGPFHRQISRGIRKDVVIGIRQGVFAAEPSDLMFASLLAVVATALRARLDAPGRPGIEAEAATLVLRMLGIDDALARRLPGEVALRHATGPIPTVTADLQTMLALLQDDDVGPDTAEDAQAI
jgi:AcrR family transcriptional regulator